MARCTSAAATAESTPPDSPQIARPSPTCSRISSTCSSTMFSMVQDGRHPASSRKRARMRVPCSVCMTSGWNWTPNMRRAASSTAATGVASVRAVTVKPGGGRRAGVPVRHPHPLAGRASRPAASPRRGAEGVWGEVPPRIGGVWGGSSPRQHSRAVLGGAGPLDRAAEPGHHQLEAVADAQDRHAGVEEPGRRGRRAVGVDRRGAAGQDDRLGPLGQHLRDRHRRRDDLGVDVALAHPAGDQLRVLRAEVDDENGVKATGHADRLSPRTAFLRGLRV